MSNVAMQEGASSDVPRYTISDDDEAGINGLNDKTREGVSLSEHECGVEMDVVYCGAPGAADNVRVHSLADDSNSSDDDESMTDMAHELEKELRRASSQNPVDAMGSRTPRCQFTISCPACSNPRYMVCFMRHSWEQWA